MWLIRHGQSYFNLHFNAHQVDPGIEDPELTPLGQAQAAAAVNVLAGRTLTRILISPFTRALQTAQPFLDAHRSASVEILQEVRERAAFACDIGSPPEVLAERFPQHQFGHLPRRWWFEGTETAAETVARADAFRARLAPRTDGASTLLVSHWAFLLALTGVSLANGQVLEYDPAGGAPGSIDWEV